VYFSHIVLYDKGDVDSYRQQLRDVDWETMFGYDDVDTIVDIIANTIVNTADNTIPNRLITVRKDSRPWITISIKKFIRRKNRIHKKAKHANSINHWEKYRKTRNKCNNLIKMAKNDYFSTISEKIKQNHLVVKIDGILLKDYLVQVKVVHYPLQTDEDLICDNLAKFGLINDFFSEESNMDDSNSTGPEHIDPLYGKQTQLHITETDIADVLKLLDTTKAIGPDLINPRLIIGEGASILKLPLCRLFNLFLSTCRFPTEWNLSNITPVFKKDNPSSENNYRSSISLISVLDKVLERYVYKHIYIFFYKVHSW
jgi:hypothetical protein